MEIGGNKGSPLNLLIAAVVLILLVLFKKVSTMVKMLEVFVYVMETTAMSTENRNSRNFI